MNVKERLNELTVKRNSYIELLEERKKRNEEIKRELQTTLDSQMFVQAVAESVQSQLSSKIDNIVNLGLATCFPDYTFEMKYVPSRGKTEVQFIVKDGKDVIDPMIQCGGGLVDVLCFCLRIAVYSISNVNNIIVFDEPFRFVSKNLRGKVSDLLYTLCDKLNLQLIEVTHIEELAENSNSKITIRKRNGVSELI